MATTKLTTTVLEAAILEAQKRHRVTQIVALRAILTGVAEASTPTVPGKQKSQKWSAAARKRMSAQARGHSYGTQEETWHRGCGDQRGQSKTNLRTLAPPEPQILERGRLSAIP
jgi:hypothetical protein